MKNLWHCSNCTIKLIQCALQLCQATWSQLSRPQLERIRDRQPDNMLKSSMFQIPSALMQTALANEQLIPRIFFRVTELRFLLKKYQMYSVHSTHQTTLYRVQSDPSNQSSTSYSYKKKNVKCPFQTSGQHLLWHSYDLSNNPAQIN